MLACAIDSSSVYYYHVHLKEMNEDNFNELLKVHNTRARVVTGVTRQDHISSTIARMYCNRFGESIIQDWHAGLHVSNSHRSSHLNPSTRYLICWQFAISGTNSFADVSYRKLGILNETILKIAHLLNTRKQYTETSLFSYPRPR